jgi:hypothetical protein
VLEIDQRREEMIWRVVSRYAELRKSALAVSSGMAYASFDGLFQHALLKRLAGVEDAVHTLRSDVQRVLDTLIIGH